MSKIAQPDHPIHELIAQRWSPYCFEPRAVEPDKLASCLEAARWAASSYNEQPWTYIMATRDDQAEFTKLLGCLLEANQVWAQHAGVLLLGIVSNSFSRNGNPNRVAQHDLGLAAGNLSLQATALGLSVHQMAGINPDKCRVTYGIPESQTIVTAIAIGYAASPDASDPQLAERDRAGRGRKTLSEFVYRGQWGQSAY
ncbi:MAG: nitroreductase family protein [Planctomycetes bacterium]|nr:nitroreductase family protein [Planctomycetota bacterium]